MTVLVLALHVAGKVVASTVAVQTVFAPLGESERTWRPEPLSNTARTPALHSPEVFTVIVEEPVTVRVEPEPRRFTVGFTLPLVTVHGICWAVKVKDAGGVNGWPPRSTDAVFVPVLHTAPNWLFAIVPLQLIPSPEFSVIDCAAPVPGVNCTVIPAEQSPEVTTVIELEPLTVRLLAPVPRRFTVDAEPLV